MLLQLFQFYFLPFQVVFFLKFLLFFFLSSSSITSPILFYSTFCSKTNLLENFFVHNQYKLWFEYQETTKITRFNFINFIKGCVFTKYESYQNTSHNFNHMTVKFWCLANSLSITVKKTRACDSCGWCASNIVADMLMKFVQLRNYIIYLNSVAKTHPQLTLTPLYNVTYNGWQIEIL